MKDKSGKFLLIVVGFVIIVIALIIAFQPKKPVNWTATYLEQHTRPYGDYVLFQLLPSVFPDQKVKREYRTLYEELDYFSYDQKSTEKEGTYIIITKDLDFGKTDWDALEKYVKKGNDVFIAAEHFPNLMEEALGFDIKDSYLDKEFTIEDIKGNTTSNLSLNFVNSLEEDFLP